MKKFVPAIIVIAAAAAFSTSSALAAGSTVITNCASKPVSAPAQLVLFCGDGNDTLSGMRWQRWGASGATTSATESINLCQPNCAAGHDHDYRVRVKASDRKNSAYHRLTVTFTGKRPRGEARVQSFNLTAHGPVIV